MDVKHLYKLPLAGLTSAYLYAEYWLVVEFHCKTTCTYMLPDASGTGSLEVGSASTYEMIYRLIATIAAILRGWRTVCNSHWPIRGRLYCLFASLTICFFPPTGSSASTVHAAAWPSISSCKTSPNSKELTPITSPNPVDNKPASTLNTCRKQSTAQQHRQLTASLSSTAFRIAGIRIVISRPRCCHSLRDDATILPLNAIRLTDTLEKPTPST